MVLHTPGQILPPPPIGPDPNSVLGALEDGGNVSIKSAAGVYIVRTRNTENGSTTMSKLAIH